MHASRVSVLHPRYPPDLVVSRREGAGGGGSARDGGGHINNYPWRRGVGKTQRRASDGRGERAGERRNGEREGGREREIDGKGHEARENGAGRRGKSGWKKWRDGGGGDGGGGKRSLGSTGVKSRHQTQAALPPSFDPSPPLIQTTLPHFPLSPIHPPFPPPPPRLPPTPPYPNLRRASTFASFWPQGPRGVGGSLGGWSTTLARRSALTHAPQSHAYDDISAGALFVRTVLRRPYAV